VYIFNAATRSVASIADMVLNFVSVNAMRLRGCTTASP
jgi:hypothetical protein